MLTLDPTTLGEYFASADATARAQAIVAALADPVTVRVYDGNGQVMGQGTLMTPWAQIDGSALYVMPLTSFVVTESGEPNPDTWYLQFESGSRWLRGSFGLLSQVEALDPDFFWSLPSWTVGQGGQIGQVTAHAIEGQTTLYGWTIPDNEFDLGSIAQGGTADLSVLTETGGNPAEFTIVQGPAGVSVDPQTGVGTFNAAPGDYTGLQVALTRPIAQVTGLDVQAAVTTATLTWSPLDHVTGYFVEQLVGAAWTQIASTTLPSHSVSGLSPSTAYSFRVRGTNGVTVGPYSATGTATTGAPPQAGDFEPAITGEPQPEQYLIVDSGSGPTRDRWNNKLRIDWVNVNSGDYTGTSGDPLNLANDVPQGGTPFGEQLITAVGPATVDVTALVRRALLTGENKGFHLKASGTSVAFTIGGRLNADPSFRPTLTVVTSNGPVECPCTASVSWDVGSALPRDGRSTCLINTNNRTTVLNWDLSGVTGTVTSATMGLYFTARSGTNTRVRVFESNPPTFFLGAGSHTPVEGLASEFPGDNFGSDPRVYKAWDFSGVPTDGAGNVIPAATQNGMDVSLFNYAYVPKLGRYVRWGRDNPAQVIQDPDAPGTYYFRGGFTPPSAANQDRRRQGLNALYSFLGTPLASDEFGLYPLNPANKIEEVWHRLYFMLETDFVSTIEGFKSAITLELGIGHWNPLPGHFNGNGGYWGGSGGNGGSPNNGMHSILNGAHEYKGNMQRMENGVPAEAGTTYEQIMPFTGYNYHIDHTAYPPLTTYTNIARSRLHKGRWYCVEQYLKLNSVVGPFDSLNNGTPLYDGEIHTWVNGVKVDYRGPLNGTGYRWRRCPDMGIGAVGTTWYMGGQAIHPADEAVQHYRVSNFVAASQYIGPRVRP